MLYFCPENLKSLEKYLKKNSFETATYLAGGTDIMPRFFDDQDSDNRNFIDIKKISKFKGIRENDQKIMIGALTTVEDILKSDLIQQQLKSLTMASRDFAGLQIRNRATLGGNICNASPAGDLLPALYAFDAEIKIWGPSSERIIPLEKFILGPGKTDLKPSEILASVSIKKRGLSSIFYKLGLRQAMAIAVVNFAVVYKIGPHGAFDYLKIAAGSVGPEVVYLKHFYEAVLSGQKPGDVIDLVDRDIKPIDDLRGSAAYRTIVLKNTILDTLENLNV